MPSTRLAPAACAAAMLLTLTGSIVAQNVPTAALGKPVAKSKYTLGVLFSMQELPDGRVVASDTKEAVFRLIDLAKGDVSVIGKQGDDAESYRAASLVMKLPGDSLGLYDPFGRKLLRVTPKGTVDRFVPLPTMINGRNLGTPIGMDQNGSLYLTMPEKQDPTTKMRTGVSGLTRLSEGADADEPQLTTRTLRADQLALKGRMPYVFKDAVAVRSDGLMARVVADTYEVVWGRNAKEVGRTGPIPYTPILLTKEEIQATKDSANETMKTMMANAQSGRGGTTSFGSGGMSPGMAMGGGGDRVVIMGGGGGAAPVMMGAASGGIMVRELATKDSAGRAGGGNQVMTTGSMNPADLPWGDFPEAKPAFRSGTAAVFDAAGNLWIARNGKVGDAVPHYDVVAEGKGLISHVNLPSGTRLLGFGKGVVYLARADEGSDWLERYAMPKLQ